MKISAIIDAYNASEFIAETIQSVRTQERLPDELIIVDDGSTDGTAAIVEQEIADFPCPAILIQKENGGQLSCITTGILESTGDFLALLDGDDLWKENHLTESVRIFKENPDISLYFCDYEVFGGEFKGPRRYGNNRLNSTLAATYLGGAFFGNVTSTLVFNAKNIRPYLPLPYILEQEWVMNADNALINLSCMAGIGKYSSTARNVKYRVHANNMHKQAYEKRARQIRRQATQRLLEYFRREFYISDNIHKCLFREYEAHGFTSRSLKRAYTNAVKKSNIPWYKKLHLIYKIRK